MIFLCPVVKESSPLYETQGLTIVFKRSRHYNIIWVSLIQITLWNLVCRGSALYYSSVYAWFSFACDFPFKLWKYFAFHRACYKFHSGISSNTWVFVLIPNVSIFCTFILPRYFVVFSSFFLFPIWVTLWILLFRKFTEFSSPCHKVKAQQRACFFHSDPIENTCHPWPIHKRVESWKIPRYFLHTFLLLSPLSVAFHAAL